MWVREKQNFMTWYLKRRLTFCDEEGGGIGENGVTLFMDDLSQVLAVVCIPNKGHIPSKIFRVQTGRIPSWTYTKADTYRRATVFKSKKTHKVMHH